MPKVTIEKTDFTKQFKCPACDELCDSKGDARTHCQEDIVAVYLCDECGEEFDTAALAKACCPTYVCPECGEGYDMLAAAESCDCQRDNRQIQQIGGAS